MAKLLRRWDDWSDGQGFLWESLGAHGVAWGNGMYGANHRLTPMAAIQSFSSRIDTGYLVRHGFINKDSSGNPHLYVLADNGTDSKIYKFDMTTGVTGEVEGADSYTAQLPGHPVRFEGNWLWTMRTATTDIMFELTAGANGSIDLDTIAEGDASSGGGHLITYGHQLAKVSPTAGVSILSTNGNPIVNADWGSHFPVGDDSDTSIGAASIQGRAYVKRGRGLYTFNDRGRAGSIFEDFEAFQQESLNYWTMTNWKGGLVFTRQDTVYYWSPGRLPVAISIGARELPDDYDNLQPFNNIKYQGIATIGEYIYVGYQYYKNPISTIPGGILVGKAKNGNPTDIAWWTLGEGYSVTTEISPIIVTDSDALDSGNTTTALITQNANTLHIYPLGVSGGPAPSTFERLRGASLYSGVQLPYIDLHETDVTTVRIHVENMLGTITPKPTTRQHFHLSGPKQEGAAFESASELMNRAVLKRMYTNGVHEVNVRNLRTSQGKVSLAIGFEPETTALAVYPPSIRAIELYGD